MDKRQALKKHFGYTTFRQGQEGLIDQILSGRDVLGIMPTGGGKSICYQLPALLSEGTAIVVSPLISLMKDQVDGLLENGVPSTYINSSLSPEELSRREEAILEGRCKLVYVAPERLDTRDFLAIASRIRISLVAVDEAHCISQWGHDFRPSYKEIPRFIRKLPQRPPVAAFTATATRFVKEEIKSLLELDSPYEVATGFDRPNLFYKVAKPQNKLRYVADYVEGQHPDGAGIIFCATRKAVESLAKELQKKGHSVEAYHAGFESEQRKAVQENFMFDRTRIIVATNAFGMGIDKPDVRFVIHYNMPKNMEAYYQEAGRAGRDGGDSECILLYSPADIVKQKLIIANNAEMGATDRDDLLRGNLQTLVNHCHTQECLRASILGYFGESQEVENCGRCGNCLDESEQVDMTTEAQKILSCIYRTNQRYGAGTIIKVLRGSKDKRIQDLGLDGQSTYGIMADRSEGLIKEIIMHLIAQGFVQMAGGAYPTLALSQASRQLLKGEARFHLRQERLDAAEPGKKGKPRRSREDGSLSEAASGLYAHLVSIRKKLAEERQLPAYLVFGNATLLEMAQAAPRNREEMLEVKGVGEKKFESYGPIFLEGIRAYGG
ncbi:DNA helicase RecQ [Anaerotalea alkaliphila]|uniref:DNA helicase RecQ n=1 Tax=Anaerotalea alkaliphila TaxID=2662126 RepID=A0A7X5HXH1_9FIRM|nr:DNA helicase RecQ [Anaerotalea alkaliphila]NDL68473.1 DNA helicase RecQ [Anaerotalea alkaliphila]